MSGPTYYIKRSRAVAMGLLTAILAGFLLLAILNSFLQSMPEPGGPDWMIGLFVVALIVASVAIGIRLSRRYRRRANFLHADEMGLTLADRGRSLRWRWDELAGFKVSPQKRVWVDLIGARLVIRVPDDGRVPLPWRIVCGILFRQPFMAIGDIYDTPLGDIAATLSEYRERALGAGRSSGS